MSLWTIYILECADGTYYTGITNNMAVRLMTHQAGKASKYTRGRLPVRIVYTETAPDRSRALMREAYIKNLTRAQKEQYIRDGTRSNTKTP